MIRLDSLEYFLFLVLISTNVLIPSSADIRSNGYGQRDCTQHKVVIKTTTYGIPIVCGGSLLDAKHVLTAAKCLYGASSAQVIVQSYNTRTMEKKAQIYMVRPKSFTKISTHTNSKYGRNDMVVLVLDKPARTFTSPTIRPSNYPSPNDIFGSSKLFL